MRTIVYLRNGDTPLEHATSREWAKRFGQVDDHGVIAICEDGSEGTYVGLVDEIVEAGTWLKLEVYP